MSALVRGAGGQSDLSGGPTEYEAFLEIILLR